jgi:hypothetical protein
LEEGAVYPFPDYVEVIRATTNLLSTGDFGGVTRAPKAKIRAVKDVEKTGRLGASIETYDFDLGVPVATRSKLFTFLQQATLIQIVQKRGLLSNTQ